MKVGVLGGGTMGLTVAYRLARAGHRVTVLEAAPQLGGLATWFDYGDFVWDKYYHVILKQDSILLGLIEELGLGSEMNWGETKTGFLWGGRHLSMSSHWEFLTFPALSLIDKLRLGLGILYIQRLNDPEPLEKIKASKWLSGIFGRRVYQSIWEPLLESKYGVLKDEMPATIMWATIRRYYKTRGKGDGKEVMGFLSGGFKMIYDALTAGIEGAGGRILCASRVEGIEADDPEKLTLRLQGRALEFDRVISTLPTEALRRVAPDLEGLYPPKSSRPRFLGIVMMTLLLRRPLNPYYVTNLIQKGFPFTGIIGMSNLMGPERFGGHHMVMLPRYDVPDSQWFKKSDEEIGRKFLESMKPFWPDIEENCVKYFVQRERLVQAIWVKAPPATHVPPRGAGGRIWSVNAELAGRDTLNNNAIVKVANKAAADFIRECAEPEPVARSEQAAFAQ